MTPLSTPPPSGPLQFGGGGTRKGEIPGNVIASRLTALVSVLLMLGLLLILGHDDAGTESGARFLHVLQTLSRLLLHPPDEAKAVIVVLVGISLITLVRLVGELATLRSERAALVRCRSALKTCWAPIPDPDRVLAWLASVLAHESQDSILVRAVKAVSDARPLESPDLQAIGSSIQVLESGKSAIGRTVANRLLLLSLFGTVIGLASVVSTLAPALSASHGTDDVDALLSNLQGTLATMGTAFASTAWGILLAFVVAAVAGSVNAARSSLVAEVQHFAVAEMAPAVFPISLANAVSELRTLFTLMQTATSQASNLISATDKILRDAATDINAAIRDAGTYVVDGAKAQIDVARQLDTLLATSTTSMENAANDMDRSLKSLSGAAATVHTAYTQLQKEVRDLTAALNGQADAIATAAKGRLADVDKSAASHLKAMEAISQATSTELTKVVTQITDLTSRITPKLPSAAEWSALQQVLRDTQAAVAAFSTAIRGGIPSGSKGSTSQVQTISPNEMQHALSAQTNEILLGLASERTKLEVALRSNTAPTPVHAVAPTYRQPSQYTQPSSDTSWPPASTTTPTPPAPKPPRQEDTKQRKGFLSKFFGKGK